MENKDLDEKQKKQTYHGEKRTKTLSCHLAKLYEFFFAEKS